MWSVLLRLVGERLPRAVEEFGGVAQVEFRRRPLVVDLVFGHFEELVALHGDEDLQLLAEVALVLILDVGSARQLATQVEL